MPDKRTQNQMKNYRIYDRTGGGVTEDIQADSLDDAIEAGREWIEGGEWSGGEDTGIYKTILLECCVREIVYGADLASILATPGVVDAVHFLSDAYDWLCKHHPCHSVTRVEGSIFYHADKFTALERMTQLTNALMEYAVGNISGGNLRKTLRERNFPPQICRMIFAVQPDEFNHSILHPVTDPHTRVTFLNTLRDIVAKSGRIPVNKAGTALVSDFDLIAARDDEKNQAAIKAGILK